MGCQLTATALRGVEIKSDKLPNEVKRGTADSDVEEVRRLVVEDARIGNGSDEQDCTTVCEGTDKTAEQDCRRLDANLNVILAILACINSV
jgi:hypothetical protein